MMAIAVPAAGGKYMKFDGVKGESRDDARCADIITGAGAGAGAGSGAMNQAKLTPRKTGGDGGEAVQGSLDRDIIRRIPRGPKPKAQEARGGVQVAAGDLNGDGAAAPARTKVGDITLKRGVAAEGCEAPEGK
ncbi:MAG: hypothetical protein B7Y97_06715 [Sphingomonas sp. 32-66-10]|nr:MAG: hypothetical protein B7Y97_06715 [Sphingomonas sp. 32-66-10]